MASVINKASLRSTDEAEDAIGGHNGDGEPLLGFIGVRNGGHSRCRGCRRGAGRGRRIARDSGLGRGRVAVEVVEVVVELASGILVVIQRSTRRRDGGRVRQPRME